MLERVHHGHALVLGPESEGKHGHLLALQSPPVYTGLIDVGSAFIRRLLGRHRRLLGRHSSPLLGMSAQGKCWSWSQQVHPQIHRQDAVPHLVPVRELVAVHADDPLDLAAVVE